MKCRECEKRGCPTEGMTGTCEFCGEVLCFGHLNINSHLCTIRTMVPDKLEKAKDLLCTELVEASELVLAELRGNVEDGGGCDHDSGICYCEVYGRMDRVASVLTKIKILANP